MSPGSTTLLEGWPWFAGTDQYPLAAYSEYLPPPRLARKPYGELESRPLSADDHHGWHISEYEEHLELRPGFENLARHLLRALSRLGSGHPAHGFARGKLANNPYWPDVLAQRAGNLTHERYVLLMPLALSRTQDDKGRIRWTLFGNSEQGPARAFWRSFFDAPGRELPEEFGLDFLRSLLHSAYDEPEKKLTDLRKAGLRILPCEDDFDPDFPYWGEGPLPSWTQPLLWHKGQSARGVKYLLTFRAFSQLPMPVVKAYLAGELHLLPFPGSLLFWGTALYRNLARELPLAMQIPLLHSLGRHEGWYGMRVPQSGWMHDKQPGRKTPQSRHGPTRNTFRRTHRWERVLRHDDELAMTGEEDKVVHVLFSANPDELELYGKPMARNAQVWTSEPRLLLDGPYASAAEIERALHRVREGGLFGYRFQYPAMTVGRHEVYWHRPLVAYADPRSGKSVVLPNGPLGYLTAYDAEKPDPAAPIELWPRLLQREPHLTAIGIYDHAHAHFPHQTCVNVRKLLETRALLGDASLPPSLARALLTAARHETLEGWLTRLPERTADVESGQRLVEELRSGIRETPEPLPEPLTYHRTARRDFEVRYWKTIASLAEGKFLTKNNADCVRDAATQKHLPHHHRDLDALGDHLLDYYRKTVAASGMTSKALVGDLPFLWKTDFCYSWMGGWLNNQEGHLEERDLIVVIPGKDRSRTVIMADHYDTAYMADSYESESGARLAAAGADDNHSATTALMLGAPIFLELSQAGKLACDIWLIHLTGEEFPADCLGARHLSRCLVEGTLTMRLAGGKPRDLSGTRVQGLYVLDMIAHNNGRDRDVFQIAPGTGAASMWLAYQAHLATEMWNAGTADWNRKAARRDKGRGRRSPDGGVVPKLAQHLALSGEVRPPTDPRSTLFNTDGQIFSDTGIPCVLFMENYDINRSGYHDTHDTMANIDLDYGAALAAITIESVARAATEPPNIKSAVFPKNHPLSSR